MPTTRDGITVNEDWDPIGQRQTDSGSVSFDDVELRADEVLHRSEAPPTPRATLRTLVSQLVLTNLFVGIAEGALAEARDYVAKNGRPWIHSNVTQRRRRSLSTASLRRDAAEGSERRSARDARRSGARCRVGARRCTRQPRSAREVALAVAEAKVLAHRAALDVSQSLFDACGARATHGPLALDRFWRNARVHTLHDPLDYKLRDIGRFALSGVLPEANLYS